MHFKHVIQLILNGSVEEAIGVSAPYFDALSPPQHSDIAYFEPRMQNESGHFCRLAAVYENLFSTVNLKMAVLHRHGWDSDRRQNWSGIFLLPDHVVGVSKISTRSQMASFTQYFEYCFNWCLKNNHASLAVFPTTRYLTVQAAIHAVEKAPGVFGAILGIMETDRVPDCDDQNLIDNAFRSASELIRTSRKTFLVFAESDAVRDYLLRFGFPSNRVFVNPYPAAHRFGDINQSNRPVAQMHFGSLGGTREVHNPDLLATFLLNTTHRLPGWTVRLNLELVAAKLKRGVTELRQALRDVNVNLLERHLGNADYDQALQSFDVMLLPYGVRYQTMGSGIFLESICAGVVPLVPAGSTMSRLYQELGGQAPAIASLSISGIEVAYESCIQDFGELKGDAVRVHSAWLSHNQGPLSWSRRVLSFVQHQSVE